MWCLSHRRQFGVTRTRTMSPEVGRWLSHGVASVHVRILGRGYTTSASFLAGRVVRWSAAGRLHGSVIGVACLSDTSPDQSPLGHYTIFKPAPRSATSITLCLSGTGSYGRASPPGSDSGGCVPAGYTARRPRTSVSSCSRPAAISLSICLSICLSSSTRPSVLWLSRSARPVSQPTLAVCCSTSYGSSVELKWNDESHICSMTGLAPLFVLLHHLKRDSSKTSQEVSDHTLRGKPQLTMTFSESLKELLRWMGVCWENLALMRACFLKQFEYQRSNIWFRKHNPKPFRTSVWNPPMI